MFRTLVELQRGYNCTLDLKKNADRVDNNLVLNLSHERLTFGMNTVLRRGVQFAPILPTADANMQTMHEHAIADFMYVFASKLEWAYRRMTDEQSADGINGRTRHIGRLATRLYCDLQRRFNTRASVISRDLSFQQLELLAHAHSMLHASEACYTRIMNISSAESAGLHKLRKLVRDRKIVIRKADKSRQIVICDYEQYQRGVVKLLDDRNNYVKIDYNENRRTAALLIQIVHKHEAFTGKNLSRLLLSNTRNPKARVLYGLPKTHKPREKWNEGFPPLRPICPDVGTETSASGRYIAAFLQPYFERLPSYLRNSVELVRILNEFANLPRTATFMVADIDSLYPNIPVQDAYESVQRLLRADSDADARQVDLVLDLLKVHLENNYFAFNDKCYKQIRGIPMGRAWAPTVASIFMAEWDLQFLRSLPNRPIVYRRYIDDVFCLFGHESHAAVAKATIDTINPNIRAGDTSVAIDVHFLDLRLRICPASIHNLPLIELSASSVTDEGHGTMYESIRPEYSGPRRVHISLYRKDTDLMCLLHHDSAHTRALKLNVLFGQLVRIFRLSNDHVAAGWHMRQLVDIQSRFRGLQLRDSRTAWSRFLEWAPREIIRTGMANTNTTSADAPENKDKNKNVERQARARTLLRVPFTEKKSTLRNVLVRLFDMMNETERQCVGELSVVNRPSVSLQRILF
jgi:hypothetical protein